MSDPIREQARSHRERIPDLKCILCGSEPAREKDNSVYMDNRTANAANVTSNTGTVNTIPTRK
ncbi:hypothetical protein RS1P1_28800 [Pseudomonas moraviensis]|nr:hypothetical protein RS1P1_28800 [Pseudomonas moraviensis]